MLGRRAAVVLQAMVARAGFFLRPPEGGPGVFPCSQEVPGGTLSFRPSPMLDLSALAGRDREPIGQVTPAVRAIKAGHGSSAFPFIGR